MSMLVPVRILVLLVAIDSEITILNYLKVILLIIYTISYTKAYSYSNINSINILILVYVKVPALF